MENLTKQVWEIYGEQIKVFKRNEYLVQSGNRDQSVFFVLSGAVRVFLIAKEEEHTIRFGYKGSTVASFPGYYTGEPAIFNMQCLKKTEVIKVSKSQIDAIVESDTIYLKEYVQLLEGLAIQMVEREIDLLTSTPIERLHRVLERSPQLFQEVPLKYIASYLRMTPETLSRIMNAKI